MSSYDSEDDDRDYSENGEDYYYSQDGTSDDMGDQEDYSRDGTSGDDLEDDYSQDGTSGDDLEEEDLDIFNVVREEYDGNLKPDLEGYYNLIVTYKDGKSIDLRRVVTSSTIVLDNGDVIRLEDPNTIDIFSRMTSLRLEHQSITLVTVRLAGRDYEGYQYTPINSQYRLGSKVKPYIDDQVRQLRVEISKAVIVDKDAKYWGIRWDGDRYIYSARIPDIIVPSEYSIEIDNFLNYINYLQQGKIDRRSLSKILKYLLPSKK